MGNAMGSYFSGRNRVVPPDSHITSNHGYIYPSHGGLDYFSSHYYLGSKKFETTDPESFLYGDLPELNYMTHSPCPFPYKQPPKKKPIECLNALVFVHKETVKLVKGSSQSDDESSTTHYTIQFKFDCDCDCNVYVICMLDRLLDMASLKGGTIRDSRCWLSQQYTFKKGLEQQFSDASLILPLDDYEEDQLSFDPLVSSNPYPLVILVETNQEKDYEYQSLMTMCTFEKTSLNELSVKVLKQKFLIDGLEYIYHEVYGLENKKQPQESNDEEEDGDNSDDDDDEDDELGAECVICFTDVKDTIILPCRHFCLCASCAADLRYQASNCPICRAPFQALIQIQAAQRILKEDMPDDDEISNNPELYCVPGYKVMSLLQGLNGYPKIKKSCDSSNDCDPPILLASNVTDDNDEFTGTTVVPASKATSTNQDTAITIETLPNDVIISLDDNEQDLTVTNSEPLVDIKGQHALPDLIPPGSIPGTPEDEHYEDTRGRISNNNDITVVSVTAHVEFSDNRQSFSSSTDSSTTGGAGSSDDLISGNNDSPISQHTEIISIKSSTSDDVSVGSQDALIQTNK